jgi:hypothetical protein
MALHVIGLIFDITQFQPDYKAFHILSINKKIIACINQTII